MRPFRSAKRCQLVRAILLWSLSRMINHWPNWVFFGKGYIFFFQGNHFYWIFPSSGVTKKSIPIESINLDYETTISNCNSTSCKRISLQSKKVELIRQFSLAVSNKCKSAQLIKNPIMAWNCYILTFNLHHLFPPFPANNKWPFRTTSKASRRVISDACPGVRIGNQFPRNPQTIRVELRTSDTN